MTRHQLRAFFAMGKRRESSRYVASKNLYLAHMDSLGTARSVSEDTARAIDAEMRRITGECHDEARRLLAEYRRALDALAGRCSIGRRSTSRRSSW